MKNKTKDILEVVFTITLMLGLSSCGEESSSSSSEEDSSSLTATGVSSGVTSNGVETIYEGTWSRGCVNDDPMSYNSVYKVSGNTIISENHYYSDAIDCEGDPTTVSSSSYYFTTAPRTKEGDVGEHLDLTGVQHSKIYNDQDDVDRINEEAKWEYTDWEVGVVKVYDNSDYILYSLIGIVESELCFGMSGEGTDDGSSSETRHVMLFEEICHPKVD